MEKLTTIEGAAAPLLQANIDTDTIIRVERLTQTPRAEMGAFALEALRLRRDGQENPDCVLNQPAYRTAPILLAGANFGCGSSREGAVWALQGRGIRCVIAEGFGDIFYNNCFQNGLLPVRMPADVLAALAAWSLAGHSMRVDLRAQVLEAGEQRWSFEINPVRRTALLEGTDEIGQTMQMAGDIAHWEESDRRQRPWIWTARQTAE